MASITLQNGKAVLRDGKISAEQECCCTCDCMDVMPQQITITLDGSPSLYAYGASDDAGLGQSALFSSDNPVTDCGGPGLFVKVYGAAGFPWPGFGKSVQPDCSVVLDLVTLCPPWRYVGYMPQGPAITGASSPGADCGGELNQRVQVVIERVAETASVLISRPFVGGTRATATCVAGDGVIESVTLTDGGSKYAEEIIERVAPTVTLTVDSSSGSGATLTATLVPAYDSAPGSEKWTIGSVSIGGGGGSGYDPYDSVSATISGEVEYGPVFGIETDEYGSLTGVIVANGGSFYEFHATGTARVADVTVEFSSLTGTGATATATVDADLDSPTFGQITDITLTGGGSDYHIAGSGAWIANIFLPGGPWNADPAAEEGLPMFYWDYAQVLSGGKRYIGGQLIPLDDPMVGWDAGCQDQLAGISGRVSSLPCPTDLLGREYGMRLLVVGTLGPGGEIGYYPPPPVAGATISRANPPGSCVLDPAQYFVEGSGHAAGSPAPAIVVYGATVTLAEA